MAIYDASGNALTSIYDKDGNLLTQCYDKDGNPLMSGRDYDLVVMTYNPQRFSNPRQEMHEIIINTYAPDLVGMQEAPNTLDSGVAAAVFADYRWRYLLAGENAIYSKSLRFFDVTNTAYTSQILDTRYCVKCYFTFRHKRICWINTHLTHKRTEEAVATRIAQMGELFDIAEQEDYVIITGDFNTGAMSMETDEWVGTYKPFVDAGYNLSNCDERWGFTKTYCASASAESLDDFTYPTDNIITSGNIDIVNRIIDTTKLNYQDGTIIDHVPVIAYLKIR